MKTILLVDDEEGSLLVFGRFVAKQGYKAVLATNGEEANKLFIEHMPDVVFLDNSLGGTSGVQVLQQMRSTNSTVKIFFVTGSSEESLKEECTAMGGFFADGYLPKPIDLVMVKRLLDELKGSY